MADTKITGLTELTGIESGDLLVVVDDPGGSPTTKKITVANLQAGIVTGSSQIISQTIIIEQNIELVSQPTKTSGGSGKGKQEVVDQDLYYISPSGSVYQITAPRMLTYEWNGILFVSTGSMPLYNQLGNAYTFQHVFLSAGQAPTDASIIVDVNKNGSSIFNTKPSIGAGAVTGSSADFSVTTWNPGDLLTVDIDQIGSGTAGSNMVAHIVIKQGV